MLRVEKVGAHELEEFLREFVGESWSKSSLDRLTRKEEYVGLQLTVLLVKVVRTTFSENSEPV